MMTQKDNGKRPRITLYSHDTQGLGHLRRNLRIATTLANSHLSPDILLITGAREVAAFELPPRTDCLVLPGLGKRPDGQYHSRSLSIPLSASIQLRAKLLMLSMAKLSRRIQNVARDQRKREREMAKTAAETIGAIQIVKAFSLEKSLEKHFVRQNKKSIKDGVKGKRRSARLGRTVDVLIAVGTALVVWYGAWLVIRGAITIGGLIVFLSYLKGAFKPTRSLAKYTERLAKATASGERVLDKLATGLDKENDRLVSEALERVTQGRTVFIIAHDLAAAENCDLIFYLEKGRVVESGSHQALLNLDGRYAATYQKQIQKRNQQIVESMYALEV